MAELKLEDWLPMPPTEGPPLPKFLNIYWPWYKLAEFKVSNLVISPAEVNPGQTVTISCLVTNIGGEAGSYTVKLGGDFMAEQTVTLQPGESKKVAFEVTPTVAGTYQVAVDGLSGIFRAFTLTTLRNLYGVVTNVETGYALQGVKVTLGTSLIPERSWPVAYSDSSGYYSFTNLALRAYTGWFEKEGYETKKYDAVYLVGDNNELNVQITPI